MSYVGKVLTSLAPPLAVPFVAFALRWWLVSPVQAAWSPQGGPPALISGQISLNSWALPVFRMKFLFRLPTRGCKSGRLQNSTLGNTQWLSICSKTANFSWKQIILTPGRIFFFFQKTYCRQLGRIFFHWKFIPDNSVFREIKRAPSGGATWGCSGRGPGRMKAQVPCEAPSERATSGPPHATSALWATGEEVSFPHMLCGSLCCEVWTELHWLSSGANCTAPGPWTFWSLQLISLLLQVDALLPLLHHLRERLGAPLDWVLRCGSFRETSEWFRGGGSVIPAELAWCLRVSIARMCVCRDVSTRDAEPAGVTPVLRKALWVRSFLNLPAKYFDYFYLGISDFGSPLCLIQVLWPLVTVLGLIRYSFMNSTDLSVLTLH